MTTITVQVDDAVYARLLEQARAREIDVADLAADLLVAGASPGAEVSPEVATVIAKQIEIYRPLFRRLAE